MELTASSFQNYVLLFQCRKILSVISIYRSTNSVQLNFTAGTKTLCWEFFEEDTIFFFPPKYCTVHSALTFEFLNAGLSESTLKEMVWWIEVGKSSFYFLGHWNIPIKQL